MNRARCTELMERFELPASQSIATLSKGQNRRLLLLLALSQGSELAILDEPGSGLDVGSRRELLRQLGEFLRTKAAPWCFRATS